jgi:hypothetical protein
MLASLSSFSMMHQVTRDENGFRVFDGKQEKPVLPYFVDPLLKRMNPEQLKKFVEQGNRIRVIRLSDGEHRLQAMVPGKGGGFLGATIGCVFGKALVEGLGHGTIWTIAALTGPAAPFVGGALEGVFAVPIEAASNAAAIGCGLALAVATGPV